jgi:hypothetical protein
MTNQKYICPKCKKNTGVVIHYGFVTTDMMAMQLRGEIAVGGCCIIAGESPDKHCTNCGHEWGKKV